MNAIFKLFKGRLNRSTFFLGWLVFVVFVAVFSLIALTVTNGLSHVTFVSGLILGCVLLALYVYFFSLAARRFHDTGRSGWHVLILLIPYINLLVLLFLFFVVGNKEDNIYGTRQAKQFDFRNILNR